MELFHLVGVSQQTFDYQRLTVLADFERSVRKQLIKLFLIACDVQPDLNFPFLDLAFVFIPDNQVG
jgi:hypothetical protein